MSLVRQFQRRYSERAATEPAQEYAGFAKPDDLMRKLDLGYAMLAGILTCPTLRACSANDILKHPTSEERTFSDVASAADLARSRVIVDPHIDVNDQRTRVTLEYGGIRSRLLGLPATPNSEQSGKHEHARRIIKALFPGLDIGALDMPEAHGVFPLGEQYARSLPLEALAGINVPDVAKLDLGDWKPPLRGCINYHLTPVRITTKEPANRLNDHVDMTLWVDVHATVDLPRAYCEWAQHAANDDYVPLATWLHFQNQRQWASGNADNRPPERIPHPDMVGRISRQATDKLGIVGHARTDNYGTCTLPTGKMIYVPTVPDASISGMMRECLKDDGAIDLKAIENRHVFTDWVTGKMGVSDNTGTMHLVNLTGARAPTPQVIAHVTGWRCDDDRLVSMTAIGRRLGAVVDVDAVSGLEDVRWENLIDVPYDPNDTPEAERRNSRLFNLGVQLGDVYTKLAGSSVPLYEQYEVRPYLALFGPYRAGRAEAVRLLGDDVAHNRVSVDTKDAPHMSNCPGVEGVMPHQRRVLNTMSTDPTGAILDIRAGGGKSLTAIHDVCNLMAKGKVTRPVVIMPRNLLGPFASEVTRFTKGRLRPFVISNRVWRNLVHRIGTTSQAVIALMKRQPLNTVFLVDYGWLTLGSVQVSLGEDTHDFYPNASMLLEINPDYCCLDESHRTKKRGSGRSLATAMITGACKYRRIMSGTILHNTAVDLVGQMAQIEPMALGDLGRMIQENRRVAVSQLPELEAATLPFARKVSVPRKEWAHLLPPLIERVHPCSMTDKQRKFYDMIYAKLQADIEKDPKFKRLKEKDSKDAEARIAAIMRRKFVPLEQWLNAPNSEFSSTQFGQVFSQLDVNPEDLRSPKIDVLDEILDQHLNGGMTTNGDGEQEHVEASPNKAIIFCFNKAVTEHVYQHSKHAHLGVLYQAGDDAQLERFKNDDSVRFLYAAATSIAEGHNLQCFPGYTRVLTDYGQSVPIEEVFNNPRIKHVLSYDLKTRRIERKRITRKLRHDVMDDDRYLQVTVRDQRSGEVSTLTLTEEHPIFLRSGKEVEARHVKPGDQFITYGGDHVKCTSHPDTGEVIPCTSLKGRPKWFDCPECGERINGQSRLSHMFKVHGRCRNEYRAYCDDKRYAASCVTEAGHQTRADKLRQLWSAPEYRAQMKEAFFLRWDDPRQREDARRRMLAAWQDPDFTQVMLNGMDLYWSTPEASENQSRRARDNWARNRSRMLRAIRAFTSTPEYRAKMARLSEAMWEDPEVRERMVASMIVAANTPERRALRVAATKKLHERRGFTVRTVVAMLRGQGVFPNRPERAVMSLGYSALKYTGDGQYFCTINLGGRQVRKNPDFISTDHYRVDERGRKRTSKVIEVIGARGYTGRHLVAAYKRAGVDCLVLDAKEAVRPGLAEPKIESLLNNHYLTVERVVEVSQRNRETVVGKYKYDIDVEGNHNFFALAGSLVPKRPLIPVLVHNCADRVVEMQTYWTPGLGEQTMARAWRPDVPDKNGEVKFKRDRIWRDIILITPSVEVAKMARLISKQVSNLLVEESDSSHTLRQLVRSNEHVFEKMKPVKLNLENLRKLQDESALSTYFRAYALVKGWERREFAEARDRVRSEIEARIGRRVSNSEISALSMTPPSNDNTPPFDVGDALQAQGYVPWTDGFTGFNPTSLNLKPLAMPKPVDDEEDEDDTDDDEEDEVEEETLSVTRGDPVWTEFGPGRVVTARKNSKALTVVVPGFSEKPVRLMRYAVLAPGTQEDTRALDTIIKRGGKKGLPNLVLGAQGELNPVRNVLPQGNVLATKKEAGTMVREGRRPGADMPLLKTPGTQRVTPIRQDATRADLTRARGRITIGNHEAVLMKSSRTGRSAWIVRHASDPRDKSKPYARDQKGAALDELLRRHNEAVVAPRAGRGRGLPADDPHLRMERTPAPVRATPSMKRGAAKPAPRVLSLTDLDSHKEELDTRSASAGVFSGAVCLVTTDGGDRDELLLKSGFDRLAQRIEIRVKNPRAFRQLWTLLTGKFDIPKLNQDAMSMFADQYQAAKSQVAYLKARELPQHNMWMKQQRMKGKTPMSIMPWPLVRNGMVYVVINLEQLQSKAANALKRLQVPVGCVRPVAQAPQMICMLRSVAAGKKLMKDLRGRGVEFENADDVVGQLRKIKG